MPRKGKHEEVLKARDQKGNKGNNQLKEKLLDKDKKPNETDERENKTVSNYMALRNLNLRIMKGEFVCIIGDVGSGKSSLLSTLIGDMLYLAPDLLKFIGDQDLIDKSVKGQVFESSKV